MIYYLLVRLFIHLDRIILSFSRRFDPGNEAALKLLTGGDIDSFAKAAHPSVSVLVRRFAEYKAKNRHSSDDEDFYDPYGKYSYYNGCSDDGF